MDGLLAFNDALRRNALRLTQGEIDKNVFVVMDKPLGELRSSYVRMERKTAIAITTFVMNQSVNAEGCFGIGYAVLPSHRGKGVATGLVKSAIAELSNGFGRNSVKAFHIEAVVGVNNLASQRVAEKTINDHRSQSVEEFSGEAAFQYINRFTT